MLPATRAPTLFSHMTDRPIVSVILPTWNRLGMLREAVSSVEQQSERRWELLIVDDGSSDGTAEWVRSLEDPRIRLLPGARSGRPGVVRNRGLRNTRGRWVAFLDSDDRWRHDKLRRQLEAHSARPDARWSYTGRSLIDAQGQPLDEDGFKPWTARAGWIYEDLLMHDAMVSLPTVVVDRELLEEVGGFDEGLPLSEDYELWLRLARASPALAVDAPLTEIRHHRTSTTYDNIEVNASFAEIYRRLARSDPSRSVRRTCRRQEVFYLGWLARQLRRRGRRREAVRTALRAVRARAHDPRAWATLLRSALGSSGGNRP